MHGRRIRISLLAGFVRARTVVHRLCRSTSADQSAVRDCRARLDPPPIQRCYMPDTEEIGTHHPDRNVLVGREPAGRRHVDQLHPAERGRQHQHRRRRRAQGEGRGRHRDAQQLRSLPDGFNGTIDVDVMLNQVELQNMSMPTPGGHARWQPVPVPDCHVCSAQ